MLRQGGPTASPRQPWSLAPPACRLASRHPLDRSRPPGCPPPVRGHGGDPALVLRHVASGHVLQVGPELLDLAAKRHAGGGGLDDGVPRRSLGSGRRRTKPARSRRWTIRVMIHNCRARLTSGTPTEQPLKPGDHDSPRGSSKPPLAHSLSGVFSMTRPSQPRKVPSGPSHPEPQFGRRRARSPPVARGMPAWSCRPAVRRSPSGGSRPWLRGAHQIADQSDDVFRYESPDLTRI